MTKKNKIRTAALLLFLALLLILAGLLTGEWELIKNNGIYICYGCIGIG
ncbi:hypothetical protein JXR74_08025 [Candidatus Mcinerneyibacteriota bacterium]|nr:hypothetical protein [Candidatus Mcinerneyibacteriota bacterium]